MPLFFRLWISILMIFLPLTAHAKRVALVIGNSGYENLKSLANPGVDAQAVAQKLHEELNFELINESGLNGSEALLNLNRNRFLRVIENFSRAAQGAEIAFVYYAGHGMQFGKGSFLLPVDVPKDSINLAQQSSIDLEVILKTLDGKANLTVAVFDACREVVELEPLIAVATRSSGLGASEYRGLGRVQSQGKSRIVAFAGAAGQLVKDGDAEHSPYTGELLNQLNASGQEVGDVFRNVAYNFGQKYQGQEPEVLIQGVPPQRFYMNGSKVNHLAGVVPYDTPVPARKTEPPVDPNQAEIVYWESIKNESDPIYFLDYLRKYPNGQFVNIAREKSRPKPSVSQISPPKPAASLPITEAPSTEQSASTSMYKVGDHGPGGGIIYYVDRSGLHGLEAQAKDEPQELNWEQAMAAASAHGTGWHLPTKDELNLLYQKKDVVGGVDGYYGSNYWSSTEYDASNAWLQGFYNGYQNGFGKDDNYLVRAVRAF